jgi:hypothetical protein
VLRSLPAHFLFVALDLLPRSLAPSHARVQFRAKVAPLVGADTSEDLVDVAASETRDAVDHGVCIEVEKSAVKVPLRLPEAIHYVLPDTTIPSSKGLGF